VDRFGNPRAYVGGEVTLTHTGPGRLVGDNPFDYSLAGGAGAVWLRSVSAQHGRATVTASHPTLGTGTVSVDIVRVVRVPERPR
jgi:beta-galactosidase